MKQAICWIGGARYTSPLNPTQAKKWAALAALDAPLLVIGFAAGVRPQRFHQHADFYLLPALPVSALRHLTMYTLGPLLALWLMWRRGVRVMIAQGPYEGAAAAFAKQIARLFGAKVALVVESHGDFELAVFVYRRVSFARPYRWLMTHAARYALNHADALRPVSDTAREQLRRYAPDTPVVQFMAWVDAETFTSAAREIPLSQSQTFVYAGVLAPVKGLHFLVDAFAKIVSECPAARLELIGKVANADYAANLRAQAERLGLTDKVTFVGALPQSELARHMARARALVLPSISEGMPRIVAEALLCGLPVVASAVGGIPDVVREGETGYLSPPGDVDQLAAALLKALRNTEIDTMGQRARTFAAGAFSSAAFVEGHRQLLSVMSDE